MLPFAHAGHWLANLIMLAPVLGVGIWLAVVAIGIATTAASDRSGPSARLAARGPHRDLPAAAPGGAVRARGQGPGGARIPGADHPAGLLVRRTRIDRHRVALSARPASERPTCSRPTWRQHLLIGDIAAPLLLLGLRSPVYAFLLPRAGARPARARRAPAAASAVSPPSRWSRRRSGCWSSTAGTFRPPTRPRSGHRSSTRSSTRASSSVDFGLASGARADPPSRAGRALEDRPHHRRAVRRHVPRHGASSSSATRSTRLLRRAGAEPRADPARGPADRRRPDAGPRPGRDGRRARRSSSCAPRRTPTSRRRGGRCPASGRPARQPSNF